MTGFLEARIISSARLICPACPSYWGLYPGRSTVSGYENSVALIVTSLGISTSTGPGLPVRAMWNASLMVLAMSFTSLIRKLCFVHDLVMPTMSASWNASLPTRSVVTCPVKTTMGMESMYAVAIPVTVFVAPGPEVTRATPTLPVTRA